MKNSTLVIAAFLLAACVVAVFAGDSKPGHTESNSFDRSMYECSSCLKHRVRKNKQNIESINLDTFKEHIQFFVDHPAKDVSPSFYLSLYDRAEEMKKLLSRQSKAGLVCEAFKYCTKPSEREDDDEL